MLAIPKWAKVEKVQKGTNRIFVPVSRGDILLTNDPKIVTRTIELIFDGHSRYEAYNNELSTYYFWEVD